MRHHPIEYLIATGFYWLAVLVLDVPGVAVVGHGLAVFVAASVTHGNIRFPECLERVLKPVVITLDLHLIHHSILDEQANANFGAVLSVWDRIFGTYVKLSRAGEAGLVFGLREFAPGDALKFSAMIMTPWLLRRAAVERAAG